MLGISGVVRPGLIRPSFILFGDSITEQSFEHGGWGSSLASRYRRTADIVLRGYSGYNTRWALHLLPRVFPDDAPTPPALVTVMLGANDANLPVPLRGQPASASRQHVPLSEYKENLQKIIKAAQSCGGGGARILLMTPPPLDEKAWQQHCVRQYQVDETAAPNRDHATTRRYAEACADVGTLMGLPVVDIHAAFTAKTDWGSLLLDGLHPSPEGSAVIAQSVLDAIASHYPELTPSTFSEQRELKMDFPDHKLIDVDNPHASFREHE